MDARDRAGIRPEGAEIAPGPDGGRADETLSGLRELADLGIQVAHGRVEQVNDVRRLQVLGERVVPLVAHW